MLNTKPIRIGIIGVHPDKGWAATAHIPALQQLPQFRLEAISHNDLEVARTAAVKFGVRHAFATAEELVSHPEVDLVVVAVKVPQHRQLVTTAIRAGKAVFSEWPLGVNLAEAESLRDLARSRGVVTSIGLQTRANPSFVYARDLVKQGYVGEVLSVSMIGSGIIWGEAMSDAYTYTLNRENGAALLNVPFAHSIDGLLHTLDTRFETVSGQLLNVRKTVRILETGEDLPLSVPDQILVGGRLANGAVLSAHFRGGLSRGTNFHVEINGSRGDLIITSPVGYVGIGGTRLTGAQGNDVLHEIELPQSFDQHSGLQEPARSLACAYARIASDIQDGTRLSPTFDDAVELHQLVNAVELSDAVARRP